MEKILLQIGLVLLLRWLSGEKDSSKVEEKILATDDKDEMLEVIVCSVIAEAIKDKGLDAETEKIINDLVVTKDKTALTELINKPETKVSIIDAIGNILGAIFGIFAGEKEK